MNPDEAISAMEFYREKLYNGIFNQYIEAFDVAIFALHFYKDSLRKKSFNSSASQDVALSEAIAHLDETLLDSNRVWSCESCKKEHEQLRDWLIELRDLTCNAPLTLEELKSMSRQPVWIQWINGNTSHGWYIVNSLSWIEQFWDCEDGNLAKGYGSDWLPYRHKPEVFV